MKQNMRIILIFLTLALFVSCAPGVNDFENTPDDQGQVANFWMGFWHGFASPVMFIISLFNKSIEVYEVHNNGGWYTFGFLLGASVILGGSGGGAARRRRCSKND